MTTERQQPNYLKPYVDAAARHGAGFGALLWASPTTQEARFDAIARVVSLHGKSLLDVGCGRADFLEYLLVRGIRPAEYVGIEAVDALANAAESKRWANATIVRADFVAEPMRMFVGADVVVFSGSLNTADDATFYASLQRGFDATTDMLVFNFLSSPALAGKDYLHWRRPDDVTRFAKTLSHDVGTLEDYLTGDMTVRVTKAQC